MSRQKFTSALLVFALAGVTIAGCESGQKTTRAQKGAEFQQPASQPTSRVTSGQPGRTTATGWPTRMSGAGMVWSHKAYPTGDRRTSHIGIEKGMPEQVRVGQAFEYEIVVTNLTDQPINDVVVTDDPSTNFTLNSSAPRGQVIGVPGAGEVTIWQIGALGPHESKTIRVNGTAGAEGTISSCAKVSYENVLCSTVAVVSPKLRLTKSGPAEVLGCDDITYRFEVANTGTGTINNVRVSDPLPAGLVSATGGRTVTFDAGTLASGASKTFNATVRAERSGRYENSATASGEGGVTASSGTVATVVREPKLAITKTCAARQFVGRTIEYTITVTNNGDGPARDTVVEDTLPSGVQFVSASDGGQASGGRVTWNLGTLAPRDSKRVTMRLSPSGAGTYRNTAAARAYCHDQTVTDACQTEVTGIPAILLEVIDIEDPDEVGTTETYVITVTNQGSAADTNIQIVCTLEPNQTYESSSGATSGSARGNVITFAPLASLAAKQQAVWRLVVRNVAVGDVRFKTTMTSDQLTRPVEETEATRIYE